MNRRKKSPQPAADLFVENQQIPVLALVKKPMSNRNREAGHAFERMVAEQLKPIYPNIGTTRFHNQFRDGEKVDLCNKDEARFGRIPYNFQCKNVCGGVSYHKLIAEMPQDLPHIGNVVLHNYTEGKTLKTGKKQFYTQGIYAISTFQDFKWLLKYREGFDLLRRNIDGFPPEMKAEIEEQLKQMGL